MVALGSQLCREKVKGRKRTGLGSVRFLKFPGNLDRGLQMGARASCLGTSNLTQLIFLINANIRTRVSYRLLDLNEEQLEK